MHLTFLGAIGTVTGSRYLLTCGNRRILVDCGLFQGYKQLRLRNWAPPPFEASEIDAVVLTHAHIDHSGYLPLLVKLGFRGPIWCTKSTFELCRILLPDSGFLHEEQARFENRHDLSKHKPALPLYTQADAEHCLERFQSVRFGDSFEVTHKVQAVYRHAGHLLGAASVRLQHANRTILFSGDLGRPHDPLMRAPDPPESSDYLVVESTYGDRLHPPDNAQEELGEVLRRVIARRGVALVPTFAVGRAQLLMLLIARLKAAREIPDVPVYLDSPMAVDATELYKVFGNEHRVSGEECAAMWRVARIVRTVEQSKEIDQMREPMIILSASGMATGGRVVHHLKIFAPDPKNMILFAGYQAGGTRGAAMVAGAKSVRIHGMDVPVNAEVVQLNSMSAHADANELVDWMRQIPHPPRQTFVTHGEPNASDALRQKIERELHWNVTLPEYRDTVEIE